MTNFSLTALLLVCLGCSVSSFAQSVGDFDRAKQLFEQGNKAVAKSDFAAAIERYTEAISVYPIVPEFYFNRAVAFRGTRRFDLAIRDLEKVIQLDPKLPMPMWTELYYALGTVYQENGEYAKALDNLNKALTLDPAHAKSYNNRGNTHFFLKEYEKALADINKSLEITESSLGYYSRAKIYEGKGDSQKAVADYTKAVELNPRFAEAYSNRGLLFQKQGIIDLAHQDFTKAITIDPLDGIYYFNRANIYFLRGQITLAVADYSRAIEIFPRWAEPLRRRADAYRKLRKNTLAEADVRKAKELDIDRFDPTNKIELINP